jgi:hypothetical protein
VVAGVAVGADEIGSVGGELYVAANWPAVSVTTGTPMRVGERRAGCGDRGDAALRAGENP